MIASARGAGMRTVLIGALLVAGGLVSVRIGYPSFDFRNAVLVFVTGLVVGGVGLAAWQRAPWSRVGPLLVVAASAWFIGGFRWVAYDPAAELAGALDLVYAALIAHAVLTYPTGRIPTVPVGMAIAAGYLAAVLPVPRADVLVALVSLLGLGVAWLADPPGRRPRRPALASGVLFALVLGGYRVVPALIGGLAWIDTRPLLQLALVVTAVLLARPLIRAGEQSQRITDTVVQLATDPASDLARRLGELVGDPEARIGFWDARQERYLDAEGRPIDLADGARFASTTIELAGTPMAMIEHQRAVTVDVRARDAIARAVELTAANARLQAEVRDQLIEVRDSRRRLLLAADEERLLLERDLFAALDPQLDELEAALSGTGLRDDEAARSTLELVRRTRRDIVSLIRGWGPPALDDSGFAGALEDVVARVALPVDLRIEDVGRPSRVAQATLVFVVSEALSNVAKHAVATRVSVDLTRNDDVLRLEVIDDGVGGTDPAAGSGLLGLRDRLEALGGQLSIVSRPGAGTRLLASVPAGDEGP